MLAGVPLVLIPTAWITLNTTELGGPGPLTSANFRVEAAVLIQAIVATVVSWRTREVGWFLGGAAALVVSILAALLLLQAGAGNLRPAAVDFFVDRLGLGFAAAAALGFVVHGVRRRLSGPRLAAA